MRRTRASYLPFFLFPVNLTLLCPLSLIQYTDGPHWQVNSWLNFPASLLTSNVSPVVLTTATPGSTCSLASYAPYCAWEWTKTTSERMAFPVRPFQSRRATLVLISIFFVAPCPHQDTMFHYHRLLPFVGPRVAGVTTAMKNNNGIPVHL